MGGPINNFTAAMHYIALGFECVLVWSLLIADSMNMLQSIDCTFFTTRIVDTGKADFGRFGHMVRLLQEICHQSKQSKNRLNIYWKDVIKANDWDFILI